jgi:hypothetical protein
MLMADDNRYRILPRHEDTAEGVRVENTSDGAEVRWQPGRRYVVRQLPRSRRVPGACDGRPATNLLASLIASPANAAPT